MQYNEQADPDSLAVDRLVIFVVCPQLQENLFGSSMGYAIPDAIESTRTKGYVNTIRLKQPKSKV